MSGARAVGNNAAWTVGGYAAVQVLRFGYNVALAGLVAPKVFGVMALVNLLVLGLQMFSDLGLRQCVVQHPRGDDPGFLNTAWTVQVLRGVVLWVASALLAWPVAAFYGEPALVWLVPLAGLNGLILGFASTAVWTYSRQLRRGPLVRREVGAYALTVAATLTALWAIGREWPGVYDGPVALAVIAAGAVIAAVLEVALSYTLPAVARPRFRWDPDARGQLLRFGGWIFLSTGCTFLAAQADRLIVGKLSLEVLGVYHIAAVIAALAPALMTALGTHVVLPVVSGALRRGEPAGPAFVRARRGLVVLAGLLATGAACVGPLFVQLVYDERYAAAAGFVQLLGAAAWFTMLLVPGEALLLAEGKARCLAVGQGVRLACLPAFLFLGYTLAGVPGLIGGVAAGEAVRYAVIAGFVGRSGMRVVASDLGFTVLAAGVAAAFLVVEPAVLGGAWLPVRIAAGAMALTAVWAGVYVVAGGELPDGALARSAARLRPRWDGARS